MYHICYIYYMHFQICGRHRISDWIYILQVTSELQIGWYWKLPDGSHEIATYQRGTRGMGNSAILVTGSNNWSRDLYTKECCVTCSDNSKYIYERIAMYPLSIFIIWRQRGDIWFRTPRDFYITVE